MTLKGQRLLSFCYRAMHFYSALGTTKKSGGAQSKIFFRRCAPEVVPPTFKLLPAPLPERIQFRLGVLAYRCLNGTAPQYLAETLQRTADVRRRLRSAVTSTLIVPSTRRSTLGDRAFPVAAARVWNTLPPFSRAKTSLQSFRRDLKTTLFKASFTD